MAASERPSKWELTGTLADRQKSGAPELAAKHMKKFTTARKDPLHVKVI